MELNDKTCVPCRGGLDPMKPEEAQKYLEHLPGWVLAEGGTKIQRRWVFNDFVSAMKFANAVGDIAEREGHHPDLSVGWGYCTVVIFTHKIGGLHENDFILASKISHMPP